MSVKYLRAYLDCLEQLPLDMQRHISDYRALDAQIDEQILEIEESISILREDGDEMPIAERVPQLEKFKAILQRLEFLQAGKSDCAQQVIDLVTARIDTLEREEKSYVSGDYTQESAAAPTNGGLAPVPSLSSGDAGYGTQTGSVQFAADGTTAMVASGAAAPSSSHHQAASSQPQAHAAPSSRATGEAQGVKRQREEAAVNSSAGNAASVSSKKTTSTSNSGAGSGSVSASAANSASMTEEKKPKKNASRKNTDEGVSQEAAPAPPQKKYCVPNCAETQGDMVACDNKKCSGGEWFHYACVGLKAAPNAKIWYCPKCKPLFAKKK